jgi:hypothetical protein
MFITFVKQGDRTADGNELASSSFMVMHESGPRDAGGGEARGPHTHQRRLGQLTPAHLTDTTWLRARFSDVFLGAAFRIAHPAHCNMAHTLQSKQHVGRLIQL